MKKVLSEYQECCQFVQICSLYDDIFDNLVHIANQGDRSYAYFRALERMGFKSGFPDYFYFWPTARHHGLFIEMKTVDKKKGTKSQDQMLARLRKRGYYATYAFGAEHAFQILKDYREGKL